MLGQFRLFLDFSFQALCERKLSSKCDVSVDQTWKALPDSHEVAKELPNALITNVDATVEKLATSNLFFIARRTLKDTNQEVQHPTASFLSMMVYDLGPVPYGMYSESTHNFCVCIMYENSTTSA